MQTSVTFHENVLTSHPVPLQFSSTKSTPRESHSDLEGLIPRSFKYLFTLMNDNANTTGYRITASYLEIYNEQVGRKGGNAGQAGNKS